MNGLQAQQQFPINIPQDIDSIFNIAAIKKTPADSVKSVNGIRTIDTILKGYEKNFPAFRGIIHMYQSFYTPNAAERTVHQQAAYELLKDHKQFLPDTFPSQCVQLARFFNRENRLAEWMPIDRLLRAAIKDSVPQIQENAALLRYALEKLIRGDAYVSKSLGQYQQFFNTLEKTPTDQLSFSIVICNFIEVKSNYKIWKAIPYYKRDAQASFVKEFKKVMDDMRDYLKRSAVTNNNYGSSTFSKDDHRAYFDVYYDCVNSLADWAMLDHREGVAILPLKEFIYNDVLPDLEFAVKAKDTSVIRYHQVLSLFKTLVNLNIAVGNGSQAYLIAIKGKEFIENYSNYTREQRTNGAVDLVYYSMLAQRVEGKFERSLTANKILKAFYEKPSNVTKANMQRWENYATTRIDEINTLIAKGDDIAAGDSLSYLLGQLSPLANDSVNLLYESPQWPQLLYLVSVQLAKRNRWEDARADVLDALKTIESEEKQWFNVPYYYPAQLLYFKAHYRQKGEVLRHVLANMLFYTGRHLQHTFLMLTPENRISLYEQKLHEYFDVYHELLFAGALDSFPAEKKLVISQSLYLKNALADGNLLPNEFLINTNDTSKVKSLETIREARNEAKALLQNVRFSRQFSLEESAERVYDGFQNFWLQTLENTNTDSLTQFPKWEKIAAKLKPGQLFVETVRYTKWLSDSSSMYAAYVINDGQLKLVSICKEDTLLKLLKDPSSSPQSGALNGRQSRGISLSEKSIIKKTFQPGSADLLGELLLKPIWPFLKNKNELLIVSDGLLNRTSLAALQWQHQYLFTLARIRQLSGNYVLFQPPAVRPQHATTLLAGGLDYNESPAQDTACRNCLLKTVYQWPFLPGTKLEVDKLEKIFKPVSKTTVIAGNAFPDSLIKTLRYYNYIHIASHGFYVDSTTAAKMYTSRWDKETYQQDALLRCGIAISNANHPSSETSSDQGYLLGGELAYTDLRNCYLISLSACETGLGDVRNNLGVDGLSRALKLGGARHLLISLWKVPDEPTALFMEQFYSNLFSGQSPAVALQSTQLYMSKQYPVTDWAAFELVE